MKANSHQTLWLFLQFIWEQFSVTYYDASFLKILNFTVLNEKSILFC